MGVFQMYDLREVQGRHPAPTLDTGNCVQQELGIPLGDFWISITGSGFKRTHSVAGSPSIRYYSLGAPLSPAGFLCIGPFRYYLNKVNALVFAPLLL